MNKLYFAQVLLAKSTTLILLSFQSVTPTTILSLLVFQLFTFKFHFIVQLLHVSSFIGPHDALSPYLYLFMGPQIKTSNLNSNS